MVRSPGLDEKKRCHTRVCVGRFQSEQGIDLRTHPLQHIRVSHQLTRQTSQVPQLRRPFVGLLLGCQFRRVAVPLESGPVPRFLGFSQTDLLHAVLPACLPLPPSPSQRFVTQSYCFVSFRFITHSRARKPPSLCLTVIRALLLR